MRFQRLFGDTERFALSIALIDDPEPPEGIDPTLSSSWGQLEIWVDGICLTRHTQADGSAGRAVAWYLLPFLEWLDENAVELLNREPFVFPIRREEDGTALAWLDSASEGPPARAAEWDEDEWFRARHAFWRTHALRAAMPGAAVPQVIFHRVGDDIEISWDNERAPPPRPGLHYAHARGARLVSGTQVGEVLRSAVRETSAWLRDNGAPAALWGPLANGHGAGADGWRWLLPPKTAALVFENAQLLDELARSVPASGAFVPHTLASSLLRGIETDDPDEIDRVSRVLTFLPDAPSADTVSALRAQSPAPRWDAWKSGYALAERVRERLGWGEAALRDLRERMVGLQIQVSDERLPADVACAALAFREGQARVVVGGSAAMSPTMRLATAFGHLLLDAPAGRDFGVASSHWMDAPTVARAKAFGAMLLMPEEPCRKIAKQVSSPRALVTRVMDVFKTTRAVTAYHLYHLRLLDEDDRDDALGGWTT